MITLSGLHILTSRRLSGERPSGRDQSWITVVAEATRVHAPFTVFCPSTASIAARTCSNSPSGSPAVEIATICPDA